MSSKVGRKHFGKVPLTVPSKEAWEAQDGAKSWSDEGEVRQIVETVIPLLEAVVARNVVLGTGEYLASGEASITISQQNEIIIGLRIENDEAALVAYVPLRALLISALNQARQNVGMDAQSQALVSNLIQLGTQLAQLGRPAQAPQAPPQYATQDHVQ